MSKFVSFSITDGGVVGKAHKRLRGDPNRKPEVKKCDFTGSVGYPFWTCVCNYEHNVPFGQRLAAYCYNHAPHAIAYPNVGNLASNYIGASVFLKFFRIKGYLINLVDNPVQIRWRLCLVRIDWSGVDTIDYGTSKYLGLFKTTSVVAISDMTDVATTVNGAAVNYYAKQKDVDEWSGIKRVVIASGVLPPATTFHNDKGYVSQPGASALDFASDIGIDSSTDGAGYRGYTPIDVKVTLNDRVNIAKSLVRYYLVFESDCGISYSPSSPGEVRRSPIVDTPTASPIQIKIQGTTYFTDA